MLQKGQYMSNNILIFTAKLQKFLIASLKCKYYEGKFYSWYLLSNIAFVLVLLKSLA